MHSILFFVTTLSQCLHKILALVKLSQNIKDIRYRADTVYDLLDALHDVLNALDKYEVKEAPYSFLKTKILYKS